MPRVATDAVRTMVWGDIRIDPLVRLEVGNEVYVRSGPEDGKVGVIVDIGLRADLRETSSRKASIEYCTEWPDGSTSWHLGVKLVQTVNDSE